MTRPHRTARKSTGGKPPRKPLPSTPLNISAPGSTMPTPRVQPSTQVEQNQSTNTNAPKAYRPLVKDFNMEDSGFDLSKVKMEKNSQETATVAPPSYLQRRIPVPEPPRQKIQVSLQMASNESSDSEEEEETEQEASTTEKEHIEPVVKEKVVDQSQKESSSSSNEKPSEKPKENLDEDKDEDKEELPPNDDEDMEGKVLISHSYKTSPSNALELMS